MGKPRGTLPIFPTVFVLYFLICRCFAELNILDIEKEKSFPTPYSKSPYLLDLLESVAEQKNSPDTSDFFLYEYDYIIVGAGSAGSVLANRLSEDPSVSILLLEAGGQPPYQTEIPAISRSFIKSTIDWQYTTVPQRYTGRGLVNGEVVWPKGKSLGGSSIFNAMLYIRGNKEDYNDWARGGAAGWSYEEVLPYFVKAESNRNPDIAFNGYHGLNGPLTVERPGYISSLQEAIYATAPQLGDNIVDSNGPQQIGFDDFQCTLRNGQRCSTAKAYLLPAGDRLNLNIVTNAHVNKIVIENNRAVGVQFAYKDYLYTVNARKEVISSAGTVNSAKLLMLSGLGPRDHLVDHNIPVIADLNVGLNLQDHCGAIVAFKLNDDIPRFGDAILDPKNIEKYINTRKGPVGSTESCISLAFLKSEPEAPIIGKPDYEMFTLQVAPSEVSEKYHIGITDQVYDQVYKKYANTSNYNCLIHVTNPKSRGSVRLQSNNPYDKPLIDPNYYEEYDDMLKTIAGMKKCLAVAYSEPVQKLGAELFDTVFPGCESYVGNLDDTLECQARSVVLTLSHEVGTCKMGSLNDPTTVVDPRLRVKGIDGLRVVDGSVMPTIISGNTNAPIIMIAEKAADMIKADNFEFHFDIDIPELQTGN